MGYLISLVKYFMYFRNLLLFKGPAWPCERFFALGDLFSDFSFISCLIDGFFVAIASAACMFCTVKTNIK